jgi:hypothetical protein
MAQTDSIPVQADLFPARVTFPDGRVLDPVKAIVGHDRVWFYQLTGNEGTLVSEHPLDDISGSAQHGYTAVADGSEIQIRRSGECGCGTNKSWKPFPYRVAMTPMKRS